MELKKHRMDQCTCSVHNSYLPIAKIQLKNNVADSIQLYIYDVTYTITCSERQLQFIYNAYVKICGILYILKRIDEGSVSLTSNLYI